METLLNLKGQGLTEIPRGPLQHKQVTNLNLDDNNITRIPDWIEELTELKVLYLNNNLISDINPLTKLSKLEILQLNNNQISTIPTGVVNWKHLKRLFVNGNHLTSLPAVIGQLKHLTFLLAAENQLENIDENVFSLPGLETLNLFNNRLKRLPDNISQLINLNYLQLGVNQVEQLPGSIGGNSKLTSFEIFSNKLNSLPPELEKLPVLYNLNIADNNFVTISHIPKSVKRLSIYANPVEEISPATLDIFTNVNSSYDTYLFVDLLQREKFHLDTYNLKDKLKTIDISSGKIHWANFKHMPQELVNKWKLTRSTGDDTVK